MVCHHENSPAYNVPSFRQLVCENTALARGAFVGWHARVLLLPCQITGGYMLRVADVCENTLQWLFYCESLEAILFPLYCVSSERAMVRFCALSFRLGAAKDISTTLQLIIPHQWIRWTNQTPLADLFLSFACTVLRFRYVSVGTLFVSRRHK